MWDNRGGRDGKWCFGAIQSTRLVGVFLFKVKKKKEARNLISAVSAPSFESFDFFGGIWGFSTTTILGSPLFCPVFPPEMRLAEWEAAQPDQWTPARILVAVALTS